MIDFSHGKVSEFLARPPSDFLVFRNVCTENMWYQIDKYYITAYNVMSDINVQNSNSLSNFLL